MFVFCILSEKGDFQVHRVVFSDETSTNQVWTEAGSSLWGGLRVVSNGNLAWEFLFGGRQGEDQFQNDVQMVVLARRNWIWRPHKARSRCCASLHWLWWEKEASVLTAWAF